MMHGVVNCCGYVCCSRWRCVYRYCKLQLAMLMFRDMYGCCRWLNVFLFEVIDCCMSESGDVIIVELDTLSLLDISSFCYQLTCCSLSIVVEAQDDWWPQDDVQRAQNACCVIVFTVEEESLFALLPYLLTHHVLFDDTGCQKISNFNVCGGEGAYVMTDRSRMERQSILPSLELWLFCR